MLEYFEKLGGTRAANPESNYLVMDHYVPYPNNKVAALQKSMSDFAHCGQAQLLPLGEGICHQLLPERGCIHPGSIVIGGDSHSTTYGAFNALGMGVVSSILAAGIMAGSLWFRVPESIRVKRHRKLSKNVTAKDLALTIVGELGASGAAYQAVEFQFDGENPLRVEERMTVCNLMAETGAKCAIMPGDEQLAEYLENVGVHACEFVLPDEDAVYARTLEIDLNAVEPVVACPHRVDLVEPVRELSDTPVQMGLLGTCTNGRISDFRAALDILDGRQLCPDFQLLVVPASRKIYVEMAENRMLARFAELGAIILPPSCGPCCGSSSGTPSDGVNVISTANRNFIGRMGNVKSNIYLAPPATVAASAITGKITDPREVFA